MAAGIQAALITPFFKNNDSHSFMLPVRRGGLAILDLEGVVVIDIFNGLLLLFPYFT